MKRITAVMSTICVSLAMQAQSGILETRPANQPDGKMLTMEETILSTALAPADLRCRWADNDHLVIFRDGKWLKYNIETEATDKYVPMKERPFAFTKGNSLYLMQKDSTIIPIAESDDSNIVYGQTVSRNEFGIKGGIFMSPDASKVAFYRKDESKVTSFPLFDITTRTGSNRDIKYPMAGMDSEKIGLGIYDLASGETVYVDVTDFGEDRYLTNIAWTPDGTKIIIQVLDRSQKHMKMNLYSAADGSFIKTILTEDNEKYVEPENPVTFIKGSNDYFIYRTNNRDGYRNLYLCDFDGNVQRITCTDADVAYIANDGKHVWYTSAEVSPVENHLFRISIKKTGKGWKFGKPEQLGFFLCAGRMPAVHGDADKSVPCQDRKACLHCIQSRAGCRGQLLVASRQVPKIEHDDICL
jgi:dipeptidyl-peptidase-4